MAEELDKVQERELVRRAREGDQNAFGELFNAYREKVYAVAFRYTHEMNSALDVVQEAFLKAFRKIGDFKGESLFFTWVVRIAINLAIDMQRKKHGQGNIPFDKYVEGGDVKPARGAVPPGPAGEAVLREFESDLAKAIEKLGERHREVFLLHAVEGLAYKEIAETLKLSIGTVMSRLHYARKKLRELLAGHLDAKFSAVDGV
ncbi:MAG: RNA polymerase sigma factor [Planctomycetota bacterium]|jgi:RNA polymerase sigma-70 factor (ECF subfamily)